MGEPVVFIQGVHRRLVPTAVVRAARSVPADQLSPPRLRWQQPPTRAVSLAEEAADCAGLLSQLGRGAAHVWPLVRWCRRPPTGALDAPQLVHTLSLLEPGLLIGESADLYRQGLMNSARRYREAGAAVAADEFLEMRWPGYRPALEHLLPGALEQAVADASTCFETDIPAGLAGRSGKCRPAGYATRPRRAGRDERRTAPALRRDLSAAADWLPNAEGFIVPDASHLAQMENPRATAEPRRLPRTPPAGRVGELWLTPTARPRA